MSDQAIEQEIQAKGLTAPRITPDRIDALMASIVYTFDVRPNGSTATFAHAFLDGKFYLASGTSACVSPENFDAKVGMDIAMKNAKNAAREKLWELEGYALYLRMNEEPPHSTTPDESIDEIALVCHEVNRAYCQALGDDSQPAWCDAPQWQRDSARMGVVLHLSGDFGPEASHASWMSQKLAEGWKYGPVKNPDLKEHPCMVPFEELPREQQAKDYLFRAVVHALKPWTTL